MNYTIKYYIQSKKTKELTPVKTVNVTCEKNKIQQIARKHINGYAGYSIEAE